MKYVRYMSDTHLKKLKVNEMVFIVDSASIRTGINHTADS